MEWRYQPLSGFPIGEGPFRARGLAYANALRYVEKKLPGGRAAFNAALRDPFYDQLFLAISDYDVAPLVRLYTVAAAIERVPPGRFIEERSRWSGAADSKGVWKRPLHGSSTKEVAERLFFAFERYFPPCRAHSVSADERRFQGELSRLPVCMDGLYVQSTVGFFVGALQSAGAVDVTVEPARPIADGLHAGVPVERVPFTVTWR